MINATATKERRQTKRKKVKSGIIALVSPDRPVEIGNVVDISQKGLSFIISADNCHCNMKDPVKMDILLINENIFLEHVPTSVITDTICQDDPRLNKYQTTVRYGVKFDKLEPSQERHLRKLTAETSI